MDGWNLDKIREVDVIQGAALLLRREALNEIGLLDDRYFMYTEEVDLCYRLRKAGWQLYWVPESKVMHYGGQSTKQIATEMFLCLYQSKFIFFRKHHGWLASQIYKSILLIISVLRLMAIPLAWSKHSPQREQYLIMANHYRHLIMDLPRM
jgi:GT2 family glycosyltransferase